MRIGLAIFAALFLAMGATASFGQSLEDRLRDQLRQTTEQLRQLQDSQAALQARATAAEAERDNLKEQVVALQAQVTHPAHRENEAAVQSLQQQVTKDKDALAQASSSIHEAQADHDRLQTLVTNQATMLTACEQKNAQLLKVSYDILDKFEHVDWWDTLNLSEPFVQDSRVRLEQIAQNYGDQIYDGKFDPRGVKTSSAKKPAVPAPTQPTRAQPPSAPTPARSAAPPVH
jgi:DNA repair exonuclease SbcCD ATPase subunit